MSRPARLALILLIVLAVGLGLWWFLSRRQTTGALVLYGNVDLRQIDLPFNDSERVAEVLVQEGDHVKAGQVLARLDTSRLTPQVAKAEAQRSEERRVGKE